VFKAMYNVRQQTGWELVAGDKRVVASLGLFLTGLPGLTKCHAARGREGRKWPHNKSRMEIQQAMGSFSPFEPLQHPGRSSAIAAH